MDNQRIEEIVLEVMKKIEKAKKETRELLVVHRATALAKVQIEELKKKHWDIVELQPTREIAPANIGQQALFLEVSQDLFVKAALGIADTFESKLFSTFMLDGVKVSFDLDSTFEKSLTLAADKAEKTAYIDMLLNYYQRLLDYGVSFSFFEGTQRANRISFTPSGREETTIFSGRVLTKKTVEDWRGEQIVVENRTIITPLARDIAKEKRITIITNHS